MIGNCLAEFLKKNYRGACITVVMVGDGAFSGEVVDGFGDIIALKSGAVTVYINTNFIALFF